MSNYTKLHGPKNGIVCIGLGIFFFILNVLLIDFEDRTIRILMFTPIPLVTIGTSLLLFPGIRLTSKEVQEQNISFWSNSPKSHKVFWLFFGTISVLFLTLHLLVSLGLTEVSFTSCFFSKYFGIGNCRQ